MPQVPENQRLIASILDAFPEDDAKIARKPSSSGRFQYLHELKESVRRDLENLLNSRQSCLNWPKEWKELGRSLLNYGIPEFADLNLSSSDTREAFCNRLQTIIRENEPRFKSVTVKPLPNAEQQDRTFRFRIDAVLIAEPLPEPVVFDSELRPATLDFEVKGTAG